VDDNAVNRLVAERLLQRLGHDVTVAVDGAEALRHAAAARFDLVLMDCHMPVMDGYAATRRLRAEGCRAPIFALTAAVTASERAECFRAGMTRVLTKPLRADALEDALAGVRNESVRAA
jgi:CheY-like chemotaxis protein